MKNSEDSRQSRAKFQDSAKDQWLNLSSTSCRSGSKTSNTSEPHSSPQKLKNKDCEKGHTGETAWGNRTQSAPSQARVRQVLAGNHTWVKTLTPALTARGDRVRLTPAPKFRGDPLIEFQSLSDEGKDEGPHHPERVLKIENFLTSWTISSEWGNLDYVHERLYVGSILLAWGKEAKIQEISGRS